LPQSTPGLLAAMILKLASNKQWYISYDDPDAGQIASSMAKAMGIQAGQPIPSGFSFNHVRRITLHTTNSGGATPDQFPSRSGCNTSNAGSAGISPSEGWIEHTDYGSFRTQGSDTACVLPLADNSDSLAQQLLFLSVIIGRQAEEDGGLLLHGALLEWQGAGIILAGPSGVGKSTACTRIPAPWQCLCDDKTLIARDERGCYWAHPWPTWSRFMDGGSGGSWDVQKAVPLRAIFILSQERADRAERLGSGHAVPLLVEVAKQGIWPILDSMQLDQARAFRLRRFDTICALAKIIPCYHLKISRTGEFWREIERALGQSHDAGNP
jgi:SynChlorMet cassette protein ScmC